MDQFIQWFWGNGDGSFRCIWPNTKDNLPALNLSGKFTDHDVTLKTYNDMGYGVFFTPNTGGHSDAEINRFNAFFLDIDGEKGQVLPEKWHVDPTIITKRGDNYHVYWLLNPTTDCNQWCDIQQRLVEFYGADKAVKNPSRVMRIPGFTHTKVGSNGKPYEVFRTYANRYNIEELSVGLPEIEVNVPPPREQKQDGDSYFNSLEYGVKCLSYIDATDREQWLRVLAGFTHQFGTSEEIIDILDEWSATAPSYASRQDVVKRIQSFKRGDAFGSINTFATVVDYAKQGGFIPVNAAKDEIAAKVFGQELTVVEAINPCDKAIALGEMIGNQLKGIINPYLEHVAEQKPFEPIIDNQVIDQIITRSFWSGTKSKLFILSPHNTLTMHLEGDCIETLEYYFGIVTDRKSVQLHLDIIEEALGLPTNKMNEIKKKAHGVVANVLMMFLKTHNQRERLDIRVDMFAKRPRAEWHPDKVTIVYTWKDLPVLAFNENDEVITDYKQHFPELDDLLQMIVASRFASNRKHFYTWLQCPSDWGKGFFTGILKKLGLLVELSVSECEKAFEGAPLGRDATEFTRSLIVLFDEFKIVKSELKQLENEIPITPKNQLRQMVEVFTKLFTSAEGVESLAGENGVEDQFANRFSYIDGRGQINNRTLFSTIGGSVYADAVTAYVAKRVNTLIGEFVQMGEKEATIRADKVGREFHDRRNIGNKFERVSQNIPMMVTDFKNWVIDRYHNGGFNTSATVLRYEDGFYYLKSPARILGEWIEETSSKSERFTLSKKKQDILNMMSDEGDGVKVHRIRSGTLRSVRFKL